MLRSVLPHPATTAVLFFVCWSVVGRHTVPLNIILISFERNHSSHTNPHLQTVFLKKRTHLSMTVSSARSSFRHANLSVLQKLHPPKTPFFKSHWCSMKALHQNYSSHCTDQGHSLNSLLDQMVIRPNCNCHFWELEKGHFHRKEGLAHETLWHKEIENFWTHLEFNMSKIFIFLDFTRHFWQKLENGGWFTPTFCTNCQLFLLKYKVNSSCFVKSYNISSVN